jgi:phosphoribosylanthranilate isomerase
VSVRVKICGVTRAEDALTAAAAGADLIGLNFYPPSPRALTIEQAREIRRAVGERCAAVGVFVNAEREYIAERVREVGLDLIQFHGDEDDAALRGWPIKVIRALRVGTGADESMARLIERSPADYILLDTFDPLLFGGAGRARALDELRGLDLSRVIIAGGLTPASVGAAAAIHPYAVDVASGVESAPGVKDADKLRSFIANAKSSG